MTDTREQDTKKRLGLAKPGERVSARPGETAQVRQSFPHGRTKTVQVEVKKKRLVGASPAPGAAVGPSSRPAETAKPAPSSAGGKPAVLRALTEEERSARTRALQGAVRREVEAKLRDDSDARRLEEELRRKAEDEARR